MDYNETPYKGVQVNRLKNSLISTKNFVVRHNEAIIVGTIALMVIVAQKGALELANDFIDEHGLTQEFIDTK